MPPQTDVLGTTWDTTDLGGTYRLDEPPVEAFRAAFEPLDIQKRDPVV